MYTRRNFISETVPPVPLQTIAEDAFPPLELLLFANVFYVNIVHVVEIKQLVC